MTAKEKIQTILAAVKLAFDVTPAPPAIADPAAPAATTTAVVFSYGIDGGSTVYVDCTDDGIADIDANDKVYTDPALTQPYPDGTYKVTGTDFGFTVAGGIVTGVTDADGTGPGVPLEQAAAMATPPPPPAAPPAPPAPKTMPTAAQMATMQPEEITKVVTECFASFATGSSDDRIANLELVCKALMEYNFGWQIREAQQKQTADAAINIYKVDLVNAQSDLATAKTQLAKQDEKLKGLFSLVEVMAEIPSAEPRTLTGPRKEVFDKNQSKEDRLNGIATALADMKKK
jgi:hypothetical protein